MAPRVMQRSNGVFRVCLLAMALLFLPGPARADWIADLEAYAVATMAEAAIPGMAMAIVQNDAVIYAKGFGRLSADPASPLVNADTVFGIGSCSKAFGAVQLAILKDQGRLAWDDLVSKHLPAFQMFNPWVNTQFQVEDLLTHRSGLPAYTMYGMMELGYSTDDMVRGIRFEPPENPDAIFRGTFAYQNVMYTAASKLIEALTGETWAAHLSESIFTPLGMTRSVTTQAEMYAMDNAATGHCLLENGSLWPIPHDWVNSYVMDNQLTAGAIRSSVRDMAQWLRLNLAMGTYAGKRLVETQTMRALQAPKTLVNPWAHGTDSPYWGPVSYADGWFYYGFSPRPFLSHDGTSDGFKTRIGLIPGGSDGYGSAGIVVLTNVGGLSVLDPSAIPPALLDRTLATAKIAFKFYDLYLKRDVPAGEFEKNMARLAAETAKPAAAPAPATGRAAIRPLAAYTGTYLHPAYGPFGVRVSGDHLEVTMGPRHLQTPLLPDVRPDAPPDGFTLHVPGYPDTFEVYPVRFENLSATGPPRMLVKLGPEETFTRIAPHAPVDLLLEGQP